jgi:hypothetical protein
LVLPRRLRWFYPGDSGGSTLETPVVQPRRLWSPSEFLGPMEIDFNNLFENLFYHIMGEYYALCILQIHEMCIFEVVSYSADIVN